MNDSRECENTVDDASRETKRWYALKVFFNRAVEVKEDLERLTLETYLPMTLKKMMLPDGKERKKEVPLIGALMFLKATQEELERVKRIMKGRVSVYTLPGDSRRAASIPENEMMLFRLVTSSDYGQADYLGEDSERWHVGDLVRVTAGPLEGAVGHVCRIKGNRRLVISVRGVCAIATSYVPSRFLEAVNPE